MAEKVFYLCDGEVPECRKGHCYKQTDDNPCRHTSDVSHAINFQKKHKKASYFEGNTKSAEQIDAQPIR